MEVSARLSSKGQVTVPRAVREAASEPAAARPAVRSRSALLGVTPVTKGALQSIPRPASRTAGFPRIQLRSGRTASRVREPGR
jgi:hypothetical protein